MNRATASLCSSDHADALSLTLTRLSFDASSRGLQLY